ncbi:type II CRISPR RNA-guided endonuclease Cas9 [Sphingomonas naphthae]|uniref:CRISPR-associated endonuclease Cas9 n=1 Tax=Sphingomonas naphthae TaxID=1813468 RepID=A0ABY7TRL0_9SPHN|nr:type II CRISPR RNA-guided endonuclease Cas9 [Sphingomonas naphthae]WCT75326.1 type II CRISPR RNA-guided endonuclease Cas9 [Sphingomonas naphthae]
MAWRLGADLGANSLGWAAIGLDETGKAASILAAGSRIFSDGRDPKSGASLAVDRRDARAMRRRRDRFKQRQAALLKHLAADGLFPTDEGERKALAVLDPFALRAAALDAPLQLHHLGRAFFHLNQRRGFKSNRKTDRAADDEAGKIAIGVDRLWGRMEEVGARTFGEFLHLRRASAPNANEIPSVRTRLRPESGEGAKGDGYDFYPGRALLEAEFEAIWNVQAPHHPDVLTPDVFKRLFEIVFHQRPLRAPKIGKCTLISTDERIAKAHPLFQKRRLLEELNALMIVRPGEKAERLTPEDRDTLFLKLKDKGKVSFESLRKTLKLDPDARFNKESENRTDLKGDEVAALFGAKTRFGNRWVHLSWEEQWEVIHKLDELESDAEVEAFRGWLESRYDLTPAQAKAVSATHPPQGYGRFGLTATLRLIDALRDDTIDGRVIVYSEAVQRAGFAHHSDMRTGEVFDELPYYGVALERHIMPGTGEPGDPEEMRIGRLTNPTVHIGLNQLRRVVNRLIRAYGPPAEIAIELARELKLTDDEKKKRNRENNDNRLAAEKRSEKLTAIGLQDSGGNRAILKLWEELNPGNVLDRRCVYSGEQISIEMLFSGAVDVDHILPFGATLDDSNANKIVCVTRANRFKGKRSPYEAWGQSNEWEAIAARAAQLPRNKRWRFEPDAMERFSSEEGFLARHLVDTQYLSRLAREYLAALYPDKGEGTGKVWVSPGRLTEMVRRKLGLNDLLPDHNFGGGADQPKNRLDHRHHAIDAAVVAIVDRSMLNAIARASGQEGAEGRERIIIPAPWDGFRDDLRTAVNAITVSHRADHGTASKAALPKGKDATAGRLHNDTAYGFTGETDAKGNSIVVRRKSFGALKPADIPAIRDADLRTALHRHIEDCGGNFDRAIKSFPQIMPQYARIRRVRVTEPLTVIPIRDREGRAYKGYKGDSNYRYDVWEMPDGKWITRWRDREGQERSGVVSMFDAHQSIEPPRPHPAAKKVLSLHQNDLLAIERDGEERRFVRVVKFGQNGQVTLAEPQQSGDLKRRDAAPIDEDPFKYFAPTCGGLKKVKARKVRIDELGRVLDPGFPPRKVVRPTRPRPSAAEAAE